MARCPWTKMRGATFTCAIDTALSAWIAVAPRNLCPEILVVELPIPGCVVLLILSENIRWVVGMGLAKLISTCANTCGYIRYFLFALAHTPAIKLLACTCTCTCYCSTNRYFMFFLNISCLQSAYKLFISCLQFDTTCLKLC